MSAEQLFLICNATVLPGWAILIFAPRWRWGSTLIAAVLIPAVLAIVYLSLLVSQSGQLQGGFDSLEGVSQLFSNQYALVAGWVHYLVFDLFIGAWETRDSLRLKLPRILVIPCLLFTFFLGPVGLIAYFALRGVVGGQWMIDESVGET